MAILLASLVELVAVHLLLKDGLFRSVLFFLSIIAIVSFLGLCSTKISMPHYINNRELVLRLFGSNVAIIELANIASVQMCRELSAVSDRIVGTTLQLGNPNGTNVSIVLKEKQFAKIDSILPHLRSSGEFERIELFVNDPDVLINHFAKRM